MGLNLATILRESARTRPDKAALISGAARVTYAELDAASDRFAAGLARRGLVAGDSVVLQLPNLPQFAVACFGILKAGCVAVPVNPLYKSGEVGYVLRDSGARPMVTWAGSLDEAAKGTDAELLVAARSLLWVLARRRRYAELMRAIQVPVLLLHGEKDRLVPLAAARAAAAQNRAWRFAVARDVGHVPQLEVPEWTVAQTRDWLGIQAAEAADRTRCR